MQPADRLPIPAYDDFLFDPRRGATAKEWAELKRRLGLPATIVIDQPQQATTQPASTLKGVKNGT